MPPRPQHLNAGNAGPFTLDGTRSYRVGRRQAVIIDPGPDVDSHVRALVDSVRDAETVRVLVTHRHADHAGAVGALSKALGAEGLAGVDGPAAVLGPDEVDGVTEILEDGDVVETDEGPLVSLHTPGHTVGHLCFHWPARQAVFAGDLLLGRGETTWVAEYPGCVADYPASLQRLRTLDLQVIYPAHGPPLDDVERALDRYEHHRLERIRRVGEALAQHPDASLEEILGVVYGDTIPSGLERAALRSLSALVDHVRGGGSD